MVYPRLPWPPPPDAPATEWDRYQVRLGRARAVNAIEDAQAAQLRAKFAGAVLGYALIVGLVVAFIWAMASALQ